MVCMGWVLGSALVAVPLCDRLLALQRQHEPALWERAGRPCPDFWKPGGPYTADRLNAELAAMVSLVTWLVWTPAWVEQRLQTSALLWALRGLAISDLLATTLTV